MDCFWKELILECAIDFIQNKKKLKSNKRELQIPHNGRFVSNHQKQYIRPIEDLFLIIRSKDSIQRKQFIQPLDERAAIYRNQFSYSFKLSIGGYSNLSITQ